MSSVKMHHQEFDSPQELKNTIKCFWYNRRNYGEQESSFEVIPDGYAEIIFYFGHDLKISYHDDLQLLPSPFVIGLLNEPAVFNSKDWMEIIGIRCFPWTVFDLLGLPSGKEKVHVFEHPIAQLQSSLNELIREKKIEEAIDKIKAFFLNAKSDSTDDNMLFKAGTAMREANGTIPVSKVAAAAHATVRTLERNFKQSSGHSVKDVSGLMRFEQVRNQLWNNPDSNLAGLATEMGYTDQSHLSREFKRYSGTTPAAFARKTKQQLANYNFVAFVQS